MKVGKLVLYEGQVQGVGFRYTAHGIAQRFAVAGYVKNLPDRRVELAAEGDEAEVKRFLAAIGGQMAGYIASQKETDEPLQGFETFEIRM